MNKNLELNKISLGNYYNYL